ncbi:hypothetical protein HK414_20390 [Ramlibacter terrae]|uniref:Uncharacterized protein n=1 Tax=Ramlibacter terrae TaxID=2732511 RepID=A0ABX6P6T0_9BURK|nr:hypothetical protein HK414_20390 [Ramlibacter terrae]
MAAALSGKKWRANEASEQRRLALLPVSGSPSWDALMVEAKYMRALQLLP